MTDPGAQIETQLKKVFRRMDDTGFSEYLDKPPVLIRHATGDVGDNWRSLYRLCGKQDDLALKLLGPGIAPGAVAHEARAQTAAFALFGNTGAMRVPEVQRYFPRYNAILMEWVNAPTFLEVLRPRRRAVRAVHLRNAGAMLRVLHLSKGEEIAEIACDTLVAELVHSLTRARKLGEVPGVLSALCETLVAVLRERGSLTLPLGELHGDLGMRNLLGGDGATWLIDFSRSHRGPVGIDIGGFLTNAELVGRLRTPGFLRGEGCTSTRFLAAFQQGYGVPITQGDYTIYNAYRHLRGACGLISGGEVGKRQARFKEYLRVARAILRRH